MKLSIKQSKDNPDKYFLFDVGANEPLMKFELLHRMKGAHNTAVSILSSTADFLERKAKDPYPDVDCTKYLNPTARLMTQGILNRLGMKWQRKPTPLD
ncbi:hypothetical protein GCM10023116_12540 [Kistimonas scapharcae]|uniref:Uncharacterized protein n=1 Tax=Kistimonas scapharcae TaxID=1036133 RepID=A0ABP8V1M2_9GAMM